MLLAHDLGELADGPQAQAGDNGSGDSSDSTTFLLDGVEDFLTSSHDLVLVDVDVHTEPPFVKGLMGQEILQALRGVHIFKAHTLVILLHGTCSISCSRELGELPTNC